MAESKLAFAGPILLVPSKNIVKENTVPNIITPERAQITEKSTVPIPFIGGIKIHINIPPISIPTPVTGTEPNSFISFAGCRVYIARVIIESRAYINAEVEIVSFAGFKWVESTYVPRIAIITDIISAVVGFFRLKNARYTMIRAGAVY